ncbi:MAG: hypothetical protein HYU64_18380 [Armatimonadetes bacterium]|nr:hypothetical protein [Armatimonadota bacterium]
MAYLKERLSEWWIWKLTADPHTLSVKFQGTASLQFTTAKLHGHPHLHALVSDGLFLADGDFLLLPPKIDTHMLEELFRHKALSTLREEGKITNWTVEKLYTFHHSGFNCC